jgi:hypothetical protein
MTPCLWCSFFVSGADGSGWPEQLPAPLLRDGQPASGQPRAEAGHALSGTPPPSASCHKMVKAQNETHQNLKAMLWIRIRIDLHHFGNLDLHPHQIKIRIRIRIRIHIKVISWIRIRIKFQMTSQNVRIAYLSTFSTV